jgi:hypothetical protein
MPAALTLAEKHHPAKFSASVLATMTDLFANWLGVYPARYLPEPLKVLDPYAGVGWIHRLASLQMVTFAAEIEHPWAVNHGHAGRTVQADADRLPYRDGTFDAIATSAVYENRMRDHHDARDASARMTYTHQYRKLVGDVRASLHPHNMGAMSDARYRATAQNHLAEFKRVTVGGGLLFLNMSNSIRDETETNTVEQWLNWLSLARCWIREVRPVSTSRLQYGANYDARVEHEVIIVAQFPPKQSQGTLL